MVVLNEQPFLAAEFKCCRLELPQPQQPSDANCSVFAPVSAASADCSCMTLLFGDRDDGADDNDEDELEDGTPNSEQVVQSEEEQHDE